MLFYSIPNAKQCKFVHTYDLVFFEEKWIWVKSEKSKQLHYMHTWLYVCSGHGRTSATMHSNYTWSYYAIIHIWPAWNCIWWKNSELLTEIYFAWSITPTVTQTQFFLEFEIEKNWHQSVRCFCYISQKCEYKCIWGLYFVKIFNVDSIYLCTVVDSAFLTYLNWIICFVSTQNVTMRLPGWICIRFEFTVCCIFRLLHQKCEYKCIWDAYFVNIFNFDNIYLCSEIDYAFLTNSKWIVCFISTQKVTTRCPGWIYTRFEFKVCGIFAIFHTKYKYKCIWGRYFVKIFNFYSIYLCSEVD